MHKSKQENPEFESKGISVKVDETGNVSAVIAQLGVEDHDGDIVEATAFKNGQEVAMVWSHDWSQPVGKGVIKTTLTEAIFEGQFFMDTDAGLEAYKTVKAMGDLQEWSWGFHTVKSQWEEIGGDHWVRHLLATEVYEVSPVLKGAGIGTRTLAIKGRQTLDAQIKAIIESVDLLGERVRSLKGLREDEGRGMSVERMNDIKALAAQLRDAAETLEKSIVVEASSSDIDVNKEFLRFQQFKLLQTGAGKVTENGN
jgi:HK97 family phage prohead protease